jgi:peptidoglycan-N-acetylglucosamine deacetylase
MPWGAGYRAAVSLTYDDGIDNHLDIAMPMLEQFGFRGTFYLVASPDSTNLIARLGDWQPASQRGHELGNHSAHHPGWDIQGDPPPRYRLEDFGPDDILREVGEAAAWLDEHIGPDAGRTYAYPFYHDYIGPKRAREPYAAAVRRHCAGSRLGGAKAPNAPDTDAYALRGFSFGANTSAEQLIGYCEQALHTGGWTILDFHGVGGPWIETPAATHRALLEYLAARPIRVAPVRDILNARRNGAP